MRRLRPFCSVAIGFLATLASLGATRQPDTLKTSIHAPQNGLRADGFLASSVAADGGYYVTGAPGSGKVKVFDSASGTLLHVIADPDPEMGDRFGGSVAISGTHLVVGMPEDNSAAGTVFVYDLASSTPTVPILTLNQPNPSSANRFGGAVAISGSRVVVGATQSGQVYVFDIAGDTPLVPVNTIVRPVPSAGRFGCAVGISGTRVVVGAELEFASETYNASAYVYDLASESPTVPFATLNNPAPTDDDYFGHSVAISGTRVVVGAYLDDQTLVNSGIAYVYNLASGTPTIPATVLHNPHPDMVDFFGKAVAISGSRVVVGAEQDDAGALDTGCAYVYDLDNETPEASVVTLANPTPASEDRFGTAVAISGTRVLVGAPSDDTGATNAGSAYAYDVTAANPAEPVSVLNDPEPSYVAGFGYLSMAVSGTRMVVGTYGDNTAPESAGSVYVYDLAGDSPATPIAVLRNPVPAYQDYFGRSVAISGTRVVVGADYDDAKASNAGTAYVYDLASATPDVPVVTINNPFHRRATILASPLPLKEHASPWVPITMHSV